MLEELEVVAQQGGAVQAWAGGLEVVGDRDLGGVRAGLLEGEAAQVVGVGLAREGGGEAVQVGLAALDVGQLAFRRAVEDEVLGDEFAVVLEVAVLGLVAGVPAVHQGEGAVLVGAGGEGGAERVECGGLGYERCS